MSPRRDVSMTDDEIQELLGAPRSGVLTTLDRDGWPHSTAMWFIPAERSLLMWTYAKSQKAKNALRDPRAAFLVEDGSAYSELRGVMVQGRLRVLTERQEVEDIGRRLYERYTFPSTQMPYEQGPNTEVRRQAHKRVGLELPFEKVASWDHRKL